MSLFEHKLHNSIKFGTPLLNDFSTRIGKLTTNISNLLFDTQGLEFISTKSFLT